MTEVVGYWLSRTYSAASQKEILEAQQSLSELGKDDKFPLLLMDLVRVPETDNSLKTAAVIQLLIWTKKINDKDSQIVDLFFDGLVVMLEKIGECVEPICRKLCNLLCMKIVYGHVLPEFPQKIGDIIRGRPLAGLLLASAYAKAISDPGLASRDLYIHFSSLMVPLLQQILASNSPRLIVLCFKVMGRFVRAQVPPILSENNEILTFWFEAAFELLRQQGCETAYVRLVEVVLIFLARIVPFCNDIPDAIIDCVIGMATKSLSPVSIGASLHFIYNLLRKSIKNDLVLSKFEVLLTSVVMPVFSRYGAYFDSGDRCHCWKDPLMSAYYVTDIFLKTFPPLVPQFLSFLASLQGELVGGLNLFALVVEDISKVAPELLLQFLESLKPLATSPDDDLRCAFLKVIRGVSPLPPEYFVETLKLLNDSSSDVKYEAAVTASTFLTSGSITDAMAQELSSHVRQLITLFIQLEVEYQNNGMAIALKNLTSCLLPAITEVDPEWLQTLLGIFAAFEKGQSSTCLLIGSTITNIVLSGSISCVFLIKPLLEMLKSLTYKPALDKIIDILAAVVHAVPNFDVSLWALVPVCFELMETNDSVFLADVSPVLSNLVWRGRDTDNRFHRDLFDQLASQLSVTDSSEDWASVLDLVSDILFVLHDDVRVSAQIPLMIEKMMVNIQETGDPHVFHMFLDAVFIFYPESSAKSSDLTSLWIECAQPPLFPLALLRAFDQLSPEIRDMALAAASAASSFMGDDSPLQPVWYDSSTTAASLASLSQSV